MIKQDFAPVDLGALLWGYNGDLFLLTSSSPLRLTALRLLYNRGLCSVLSSDPSPSTPLLFDNPRHSPGYRSPYVRIIHTLKMASGTRICSTSSGNPSSPCGYVRFGLLPFTYLYSQNNCSFLPKYVSLTPNLKNCVPSRTCQDIYFHPYTV